MSNVSSRYSVEEFKALPEDLRIGIVISDGMWYPFMKWKKLAAVKEPELARWIADKYDSGLLTRHATDVNSYRLSKENIYRWHKENGYTVGEQLVDFLFPPRIWSGLTEVEGFLNAPLRNVGIVSFSCSTAAVGKIREALKGIARVREVEPGRFKAYGLEPKIIKEIIVEVLNNCEPPEESRRVYPRRNRKRRELVDFPPEFAAGMIGFYRSFGRSLVRRCMDTITIFLPETEDQDAQIIMWVIEAMEKFDQNLPIPFSGYLNHVLKKWPFDLPSNILGKELSAFQRTRSRALSSLAAEGNHAATLKEMADRAGMTHEQFNEMEERHKYWLATRRATTLTWAESSEEKISQSLTHTDGNSTNNTDVELASKISAAVVRAGLKTKKFSDAFVIMYELDANSINVGKIREVSDDFVHELGVELGM